MRTIALVLLVWMLVSACAADPNDPSRIDAATRHLQKEYDGATKDEGDSYSIHDLAFIPEWTKLVPFEEPLLARLRTDTTFYTCEIATPYYEYDRVEALVSVRSTPRGYEVRSILSPVFEDDSSDFFQQFHGLVAKSPKKKAELTAAIAGLLVPITGRGRLGKASIMNNQFSIELWHGDLHWRNVVVEFKPANAVRSIQVVNPKRDASYTVPR